MYLRNYVKNTVPWITSGRRYINMNIIQKYWRIFVICALVAFSYMFTFYMGYEFAVQIFELMCLKTDLVMESL